MGSDSTCGPLGLDGEAVVSDSVRQLMTAGPLRGCVRKLQGTRGTSPRLIVSAAVEFSGEGPASLAMKHLSDLAAGAYLIDQFPNGTYDRGVPVAGFDGAILLHATRVLVLGRAGGNASIVGWRRGRIVSLTAVAGPASDARVIALSRVSYSRRSLTRPPTKPDTDDREVPLGLPNLGVPVWWLGPEIQLGNGLPFLRLESSAGPLDPGGGPGYQAKVSYRASTGASEVEIGLWRASQWRAFPRSPLGQVVAELACATHRVLRLKDRTIDILTIPAGPPRPPTGNPPKSGLCGPGPGTVSWAIVHLPDAIATVNMPVCFTCATAANDPGANAALVEAVARALTRRSA